MPRFDLSSLQDFGLKVIGAIVILLVGFYLAGYLAKVGSKLLDKTKLDISLKKFLVSLISPLLKLLVIITAIGVTGTDTSAFVAVLGAMSFAIGLAFQGTIANFAGGVLLLVIKPFALGDFVELSGQTGVVEEIGIIYTKIITVDNKVISLPNGALTNANITNYTKEQVRRVDLTFGASYDAPVEKVKTAIEEVIKAHDKVLKDRPYFVRLGNQGASSLDYTVRVWAKTADYWDVHFDLLEQVTLKFQAEGISIPYNTMDVNLFKQEA